MGLILREVCQFVACRSLPCGHRVYAAGFTLFRILLMVERGAMGGGGVEAVWDWEKGVIGKAPDATAGLLYPTDD